MSGQLVELKRSVATTMFIVEKGKRGSIHSEENGWLFVRFDGVRWIVPVQPCEVTVCAGEPTQKAASVAAVACLLVVMMAGCFAPDLSKAMLLCDGVSRFCPDGLSCVQGVCRESGAAASDGGSMDAAAVADLVQVVTGCRDGKGADVSGSGAVFACPGAFEASPDPTKNAARLCAPSYKPCVSAAAVGGSLCAALEGFFLADVPARAALPNTSCGATRAGESPGLAGCGKAVTGVYAVPSCAGFSRALFAVGPSGIAVSAPYSLESATNITNTNGVLCCK